MVSKKELEEKFKWAGALVIALFLVLVFSLVIHYADIKKLNNLQEENINLQAEQEHCERCIDFCAREKLNETKNSEYKYFVSLRNRFIGCLIENNCCGKDVIQQHHLTITYPNGTVLIEEDGEYE